MIAMLLERQRSELKKVDVPRPAPASGQVLIRVLACAVCRTDLHIVDGDLTHPKLPLVLGHEIVGIVEQAPDDAPFRAGDRVGVPWLGWTCGVCVYCTSGRENLCDRARFTGYDIDGGYAEYCVADSRYCFPIAEQYEDAHAAPLLCAGLIGYRALRLAGDPATAKRLGIYGFGAAAHLITQVAASRGQRVFAFTRKGDDESQAFARKMGAEWAGASDERPELLDAAIIFAPAGELVPGALRATAKGGVVVCAGIHMSVFPRYPYEILWGERTVRSVANLTRRDGNEFLALAPRVPVRTEVECFPLSEANKALAALRSGRLRGAAVLVTPGL
jgi:propanol-preferring alcohol dehydrogenase